MTDQQLAIVEQKTNRLTNMQIMQIGIYLNSKAKSLDGMSAKNIGQSILNDLEIKLNDKQVIFY